MEQSSWIFANGDGFMPLIRILNGDGPIWIFCQLGLKPSMKYIVSPLTTECSPGCSGCVFESAVYFRCIAKLLVLRFFFLGYMQ